MNYHKLKKQAEDETSSHNLVARAKILTHRNDNFDKALKALKKIADKEYSGTGKEYFVEISPEDHRDIKELVAELEEVK